MSEVKKFQDAERGTIRNILDNYIQNGKALVDQLYYKFDDYGTAIGGFREDVWRGMFEQIIPKKFVIEQSVFIIDSEGRVSREVDLAIFDETYTPYIFRYGRLKFLPIEAVAVVIECKSQSLAQEQLKEWVERIAALKTSNRSCARTISNIIVGERIGEKIGEKKISCTQTATRPVRILCCLNKTTLNEELNDNESMFDIVVRAPAANEALEIEIDEKKGNLQLWHCALNHANLCLNEAQKKDNSNEISEIKLDNYQVSSIERPSKCKPVPSAQSKRVSLLEFNLQLNQILMLINNPMLFPHIAYAEMFNAIGREEDGQ